MKKEKSDQNSVAELTREWLYKENKWLWEENKKLKEELSRMTERACDYKWEITELKMENKNLKEKIKRLEFDVDAWHQLKLLLEWEIERLRWLQIYWKTVAERIEDDKKVVRE